MTATAVAAHTRQSQSAVTGVPTLLALAVRRDRVRLTVWIWVADIHDGLRAQRGKARLSR